MSSVLFHSIVLSQIVCATSRATMIAANTSTHKFASASAFNSAVSHVLVLLLVLMMVLVLVLLLHISTLPIAPATAGHDVFNSAI